MTEELLPHAPQGSAAILISSLGAHAIDTEDHFADILASWVSNDLAECLVEFRGKERASWIAGTDPRRRGWPPPRAPNDGLELASAPPF